MKKFKSHRILIKLSGESLMGNEKFGIELSIVDKLARELSSFKKKNIQICPDSLLKSSVIGTNKYDLTYDYKCGLEKGLDFLNTHLLSLNKNG